MAFDLYQDVSGDYAMRVRIFLSATLALASYTSTYTAAFLKHDKLHRKPLTIARGLWKLFGINGLLLPIIPEYLQYLRPDFHPWQHDNSALINEWRDVLDQAAAA